MSPIENTAATDESRRQPLAEVDRARVDGRDEMDEESKKEVMMDTQAELRDLLTGFTVREERMQAS